MAPKTTADSREKIMQDLGELVSMLEATDADFNRSQQPLFNDRDAPDPADVPVLTAFANPADARKVDEIAMLVDQMVEEIMPVLEREIRRRLKQRLD